MSFVYLSFVFVSQKWPFAVAAICRFLVIAPRWRAAAVVAALVVVAVGAVVAVVAVGAVAVVAVAGFAVVVVAVVAIVAIVAVTIVVAFVAVPASKSPVPLAISASLFSLFRDCGNQGSGDKGSRDGGREQCH